MKDIDMLVTVGGIIYGCILMMAAFIRTALTEALRIDILFMPEPSENTRPVNLIAGLVIVSYSIYSLIKT